MSTLDTPAPVSAGTPPAPPAPARHRTTGWRVATYVFLVAMSLIWLFPLFWALLSSLRDYT